MPLRILKTRSGSIQLSDETSKTFLTAI